MTTAERGPRPVEGRAPAGAGEGPEPIRSAPGPSDRPDAPNPTRPERTAAEAAAGATAEPSASGATAPGAPAGAAPGRARRVRLALERRPVLVASAVAAVLHVVWFFCFANSGGDLAAQDAWAEFVGRHPDSAYNLAWFGGMHPVSYSVISPYLMHVFGVRTTMMIAGTLSAALVALILSRSRGTVKVPLWPALAGVYGLFCNALSGRVTFGLGAMFALAAVAAVFCWPRKWARRRWLKAVVAAPLAGLATAASPVAGLFLGMVAAGLFLSKRRPGAYVLGLPPVAVVALSAWLFPFSGTQPMKIGSAWLPFVFALLIVVLVPKRWKTVRIASAVYALAVFLTWVVDSQIGSNVTRMVMLFGGAVLLAALPYAGPRRGRHWWAVLAAFIGLNAWITSNSVTDIIRTTPLAAWNRELTPLVDQLQKVGADRGRVEVVPASSHRESSAFPSHVNLARGWNRQADTERNPLFYDGSLTAENYREWLARWAVHYVVLSADKPDSGGVDEAELIDSGLPYLTQVWGDANWRLFRVDDPTPLVSGEAEATRAGEDQMVIEVKKAGRVTVRIPHSPWLGLVDAEGRPVAPPQETFASKVVGAVPKAYTNVAGCLFQAAPDAAGDVWTVLLAPEPGVYRVAAPYQLPRGTPCPRELVGTGTDAAVGP
ncbi:MFS transporter [Streptomyces sp. BI20]|uniref:MFS transporter n=1 Tax=Streptomyces sp. BI20 TaxID=3403460 RepID=UPI003C776AF9